MITEERLRLGIHIPGFKHRTAHLLGNENPEDKSQSSHLTQL